jgi:hypothetical protein
VSGPGISHRFTRRLDQRRFYCQESCFHCDSGPGLFTPSCHQPLFPIFQASSAEGNVESLIFICKIEPWLINYLISRKFTLRLTVDLASPCNPIAPPRKQLQIGTVASAWLAPSSNDLRPG